MGGRSGSSNLGNRSTTTNYSIVDDRGKSVDIDHLGAPKPTKSGDKFLKAGDRAVLLSAQAPRDIFGNQGRTQSYEVFEQRYESADSKRFLPGGRIVTFDKWQDAREHAKRYLSGRN